MRMCEVLGVREVPDAVEAHPRVAMCYCETCIWHARTCGCGHGADPLCVHRMETCERPTRGNSTRAARGEAGDKKKRGLSLKRKAPDAVSSVFIASGYEELPKVARVCIGCLAMSAASRAFIPLEMVDACCRLSTPPQLAVSWRPLLTMPRSAAPHHQRAPSPLAPLHGSAAGNAADSLPPPPPVASFLPQASNSTGLSLGASRSKCKSPRTNRLHH